MPGSALTWELVDGIAVVALDLKGEPVNKISRAGTASRRTTPKRRSGSRKFNSAFSPAPAVASDCPG